MKSIAILVCTIVLSVGCTENSPPSDNEENAVVCEQEYFYGDYEIHTPEDIAELNGVINISGDLRIACPECVDLKGLECLERVSGTLDTRDVDLATGLTNELLIDFTGLNNLTRVDDDFFIRDNKSLIRLSGLEKLTHVGDLEISDNSALVDISAISAITHIEFSVDISNNTALTNLHGLEFLTSLDQGHLTVGFNDSLTDLSGLKNLTHLEYGLHVTGNEALTSLDGLNSLTTVGRRIDFTSNTQLPFCEICTFTGQLDELVEDFYCHSNEDDTCGTNDSEDSAILTCL